MVRINVEMELYNMICPNCGTENPDNANFCFNCARKLIDRPQTIDDRYTKYIPKPLLKKLEDSAKLGGIENERRIVSILFCDVVGSTSHAESMDPEEWTEIISSAFDSIIPPIYKYEGILARLMGDAILAFFGAPISHEDDPERAVLAGLDILAAAKICSEKIKAKWGIEIDVRIGINTGLVVVGEMGSNMRVEYTAMGDAINVASRMESTAEPGTIQITGHTFKHISYLFDVEKIGKIEIKGKSEPVPTYKIIKKKDMMERHKKYTDRQSVFVGRDEELELINTLFDQVVGGTGKILWIGGEAGIGKSRLVSEFYRTLYLEDRVHDQFQNYMEGSKKSYWFETGALPYQISSPYSPIINFFLKFFGITLEMTNQEKYDLVKSGVKEIPDGEDIFPFLASLLQIEITDVEAYQTAFLDPEILQEVILQAIISFLDAFSRQNPLILVFDDIQWADQSSLTLMKNLIKQVKSSKIFLVILSRVIPSATDDFFNVISTSMKDHFHIIELDHLTDFGTSSLISNILKVENLPEDVREEIISKSQGNPFYVEELVRSFIESGYLIKQDNKWILNTDKSNLEIPDTLNNLLMTRLDQLDEKSKRVAQSASVIGREFLFPILQCINDSSVELNDSIHTLEEREWIIEKIIEAEKSYFFKHVLSRDVAYNSLLFKRRKELHSKIANCLKQIDNTMVDEIGRHLFEAEEFEDALPFIIKSAESAINTNSTSEAIALLTRVEDYAKQLDDFKSLMNAYIVLGRAYAMEGKPRESTSYYRQILSKSKELNVREGEVRALNKLAENALYLEQDLEKADDLLTQAEEISTIIDFSDGLLETSAMRCVMHQSLGDFDKSAEYEIKGFTISGKSAENFAMTATFKYNLIVSHALSLKFDLAKEAIEEFLKEYEPAGEKYYVAAIYGYLQSGIMIFRGRIKEGIESINKGIAIGEEIKAPFPLYLTYRSLAEILLYNGQYHEAEHYFEICVENALKHSMAGFRATSKLSLAVTRRIMGEHDEELLAEGIAEMDLKGGTYWGARTWGELGYYYLYDKDYENARKYFDYALTRPNAAFYLYKAYNLIGKIRLCIEEESYVEASKLISEAVKYSIDNNLTLYEPELEYLSGRVAFENNDLTSAKKHFERAVQASLALELDPITLEALGYLIKAKKTLGESDSIEDLSGEFNSILDKLTEQFDIKSRKEYYLNSLSSIIP